MSVRFFGQFLIDEGEIDAGDLRRALELMDRQNVSLGELAVRDGLLSEGDAQRVNRIQRQQDRPFGQLAVELGLLSEDRLAELLERQRGSRLQTGEALVGCGALPAERLGPLLDAFKTDQAAYAAGCPPLPPELHGLRVAEVLVEFLPRFAMRVGRVHLKVGDSGPLRRARELPVCVGVRLRGRPGLEMTFAADRLLAETLAAAACDLPVAELPAGLVADGCGEFLNVVAGNALAALEKEGIHLELDPPQPGLVPDAGTELETVSSVGDAVVVLRRT